MTLRDLPNLISALRLLAVPPVAYLLLNGQFAWALALFVLAGASDGLDGFLARHYGWKTRLGGILDPLADKALLLSSFLVLGSLSLIPIWLVVAALLRDSMILVGAIAYNYRVEALQPAPSLASKLNTLLQIVLVIVVIAAQDLLPVPAVMIDVLVHACLAAIVISGVQYVWVWSRKAMAKGWRHV